MAKKKEIVNVEPQEVQPIEPIEALILNLRGQQVLLDRDLAMLYGVETRALNQAVQRNIERFPEDFMFQLTKEEFENWKSQFATSNAENLKSQIVISNYGNLKSQFATSSDENWKSQFVTSNSIKMGARKRPYAFTENGIAMLSSVLRSPTAIQVNIRIMRAFTAMRQFIGSHAQMFQRMETLERTQLSLMAFREETNQKFDEVFKRLDDGTVKQKQGVFYDGEVFDAYKFIAEKIKEAKTRIVLYDNYIDESVLNMLDKRANGVVATIYTKAIDACLQTDIARHDAQYPHIDVQVFTKSHDRFLCIDDVVYLVGASLKDLGKKWCGFTRLEITTDDLLTRM